jgi:hypothetical protein
MDNLMFNNKPEEGSVAQDEHDNVSAQLNFTEEPDITASEVAASGADNLLSFNEALNIKSAQITAANPFNVFNVTEPQQPQHPLQVAEPEIDEAAKLEYEKKSRLFGIYPDTDTDDFVERIMQKREFQDSQQTPPFKPDGSPTGPNPCEQTDFEATPVQRFVANFLAPDTPYKSMLLYHGVGVGKTCAAITLAERWLKTFPRREVFIVAPPSIQAGFKSTIFNSTRVVIPEGDDEPNTVSQCTGDAYMQMTSTLYEKRRESIEYRVNNLINSRYKFFGYITLKNEIKRIIQSVSATSDPVLREQKENAELRRIFSGRLLIIDEAHNIRDVPGNEVEQQTEGVDAQADEKEDIRAGKELTPYLLRVLRVTEGLKLLLLTGTPMYNVHNEIIFMINLINANEKRQPIKDSDVFTATGQITDDGQQILAEFASRHVSFMRGENPRSFPLRLMPLGRELVYPTANPAGVPVADEDKILIEKLPIVSTQMSGDVEREYYELQREVVKKKGGMSPIMLESLVQAGNFIWPKITEGDVGIQMRTGLDGLQYAFEIIRQEQVVKDRTIVKRKFKPRGDGMWMADIMQISPKFARVAASLLTAEGVCFIYSRFVQSGALPMALILETLGFAPYDHEPFLLGGPRHPSGAICYCGVRERQHAEVADHTFSQAKYGLLTGEKYLTPNLNKIVRAEQSPQNSNGSVIKVIIGSQVAAEGIDLRYIREVHIFDSWFHLNNTEQIIGRAIRFCSHMALPEQKRNVTVHMHVNKFSNYPNETPDLYCYRLAYKKAMKMGSVSRAIKINAIDCNLTHPSVIFSGFGSLEGNKRPIDSQGRIRDGETINDMPYTAVCDWLDTCDFKCSVSVSKEREIDDMTYTEYAAAWKEARMRKALQVEFEQKPSIRYENLTEMFGDVPLPVILHLLSTVIGNKNFIVTYKGRRGYLIYKNKYIVFQPLGIRDTKIPMAMRVANFPVKRDDYEAAPLELAKAIEKPAQIQREQTGMMMGWGAWKKFVIELRNNLNALVPVELDQYIQMLSNGDAKQATTYADKIKTMRFLSSVMPRKQENIDALTNILIEYGWDIWFPAEWKAANWKQAFTDFPVELRNKYLVENLLNIEGIEIYRYYDIVSDAKTIKYLCNGQPCPLAIIDQLKTMPDVFDATLTPVTTGDTYGFLTYKKNQIVFKSNSPPKPGEKLGPGKECENDTKTSTHKKKIYEIMVHLEPFLKTNMGITEGQPTLGTHIVNPAQTCTLMELLLRFMDEMDVQGKRWFYRSIESLVLGHKGRN